MAETPPPVPPAGPTPPTPEAPHRAAHPGLVREIGRKVMRRVFKPSVARLSIDQHMEAARHLGDFPEETPGTPTPQPAESEFKRIMDLGDFGELQGWTQSKTRKRVRRVFTPSRAQKRAYQAGEHQTQLTVKTATGAREKGNESHGITAIATAIEKFTTPGGKRDVLNHYLQTPSKRVEKLDKKFRAEREAELAAKEDQEEAGRLRKTEAAREAQIIDPRNVHALVGTLLKLAANPSQTEGGDYLPTPSGLSDSRKLIQATGAMLLHEVPIANYLGISVEDWQRQRSGEGYTVSPAIIEQLNSQMMLAATTWNESHGLDAASSMQNVLLPDRHTAAIGNAKQAVVAAEQALTGTNQALASAKKAMTDAQRKGTNPATIAQMEQNIAHLKQSVTQHEQHVVQQKQSFDLTMSQALQPGETFVNFRLGGYKADLAKGRYRVEPLNGLERALRIMDERQILDLIQVSMHEASLIPEAEKDSKRSKALFKGLDQLQAELGRRKQEAEAEGAGGNVIHIGGRSGGGPTTVVTGSVPIRSAGPAAPRRPDARRPSRRRAS